MENFEQFKKEKSDEILKEMENQIKIHKDRIYDLGIKLEFSEKNEDKDTVKKAEQKIEEYKKELSILEEAYKAKVINISNKKEEPETIGTYKGPKIEIIDMEYKLSGIIGKIDKAIGNKIKWEDKKEETEKRSLQAEKTGGKYFHRIESNTKIENIEKKALIDENEKNPKDLTEKFEKSIEKKETKNKDTKNSIQELKDLKKEIENIYKEFINKNREAEKNGTPLNEHEIEEFNKKIEKKKKIIDNYIKSN